MKQKHANLIEPKVTRDLTKKTLKQAEQTVELTEVTRR
jgi:hypothetical protein